MSQREILGESKAVKELLKMIGKVAPTKTNILIIGESGTGKELVARMIHDSSPICSEPFIPVNCGAIPENLIESELFGHKKGSFTGAVADKEGLFEAAHKGTLFLDEVGELPLAMQVKLLRALQDRTIRRVGDVQDRKIDVRIISATNKDLEAGVKQGTFREDLYYRLNVIQIRTPPLRERGDDIVLLANHFLKVFCKKYSREIHGFSPEVLSLIKTYSWPGNVRELENAVQRMVTLETGNQVEMGCLPTVMVSGRGAVEGAKTGLRADQTIQIPDFAKGPISMDQVLSQLEKRLIEEALKFTKNNKTEAARLLGVTVKRLTQTKL